VIIVNEFYKLEYKSRQELILNACKFFEGYNFYICLLTSIIKVPLSADKKVYEED